MPDDFEIELSNIPVHFNSDSEAITEIFTRLLALHVESRALRDFVLRNIAFTEQKTVDEVKTEFKLQLITDWNKVKKDLVSKYPPPSSEG